MTTRRSIMKANARLRRLERLIDVSGCSECRDRRGRIVLIHAKGLADGTVVEWGEQPAPCARCGEVAEQIVAIVETVVDRAGGEE
jgi:hypothetical protein